ncbi:MAG: class I SAM-dependent methyltransferase [Candidatus Zixiibacteriota bacterium]|nr:MAG: class I SAM-dependent methyltransferase [candidate division Zixibacteria bacterium]
MVDIKKSWDKIAEHYNKRYEISCDVVHYGPLCPGEDRLRLLGDIKGKKAIDLGCGGGQNAVALAKLGADVTAVDLSTEQIIQAEGLASDHRVSICLKQADISSLSFVESQSFDIALSACSISFLERIDPAFREAYRILKPKGRFILSDMNPLQYLLDETESGVVFNNPYHQKSLPINWTWEFDELNRAPRFRHYVRMISDYVNSLIDTGFMVQKILEPESTLNTPHKGFSEEIMKEYPYIAKHIPITFVILCKKP